MKRNGSRPRAHDGDHRRPFDPLSEWIYLLDSDDEPLGVQLEVRVEGAIDEVRLRAAVAATLAHHPRARARQAQLRRWGGRSAWEFPATLDVEPLEVLACPDDAALMAARAEFQSRSVPLTVCPPLRLLLAHHPAGDVVMLNLNHAVGDGIGALFLLRSIVQAYAGAPPFPRLLEALCMDPPAIRGRLRLRAIAARRRQARALGRTVTIAAEAGQDRPGYGFHQVALTVEQTRALTAPRPSGATVNDVLLAALHLCIDAWNSDHGTPSGHIKVMMPVNLRPRQWRYAGVANRVSSGAVSTVPEDRADILATLAVVARRTRQVKQEIALSGHRRLPRPGLLPLPIRRRIIGGGGRAHRTTVLSNLGRLDEPFSFGSALGDATELWFSPPTKMPFGLSLGVVTVGGRLHLSFRYRHALLGPQAAARFADRYVATLDDFPRGSVNGSNNDRAQ